METKYLQRCMNDMVSLLALPAMWSGSEPAADFSTLLDALLAMLGLDFAYARSWVSDGQAAPAIVRVAQGARLSVSDVSAAVKELIGDSSQGTPSPARRSVGAQDVSIVSLRLGLQNDLVCWLPHRRVATSQGRAKRSFSAPRQTRQPSPFTRRVF